MKSLDLCQMNLWVLRKQHLTRDSQTDDIVKIVRDVGGLHASAATTPYLSLFARCPTFKKEQLDRALYVSKDLGKLRCIRNTIFVLPKDIIPITHAATRTKVVKASRRYMEARAGSLEEFERVSGQITSLLAGKELTVSAIRNALGSQPAIPAIVQLMCDQGVLVRGRPEKGWRDRQQRYALFAEYFPDIQLDQFSETEATTLVVRQYLRSFGPVSENDIVWWTGLGKKRVWAALNHLQEHIVRVRVSGLEGEFIVLRSDEPIPDRITGSPDPTVNLVPGLDPYLMGYKDRERYLDSEHCEYVFDRSGNATSTVLVDGRVVGVWDFRHNDTALVKLLFLKKAESDVRRQIFSQAERLGRFMAEDEVQVKECDAMVPLTERSAGGFLSPLKDC